MKRTCESCDYWYRYSLMEYGERVASGSGECRRHAPAPMYSMTGDKPGPIWWPQTLSSFWCGDFAVRVRERLTGQEVSNDAYVAAWNQLVAASARNPTQRQKILKKISEKNPKKNTKEEQK